jgi:hypothetical protein
MKRLGWHGGAIVFLCLGVPDGSAGARGNPAGARHARQAMIHVARFELREAAEEFQRAWEVDPQPSLLFKIGHLYFRLSQFEGSERALSDRRQSVDYLRRYLRADPNPSDREVIMVRIGRMELEIRKMEDEQQRVAAERAKEQEERRRLEREKEEAQAEAARAKQALAQANEDAARANEEAARANAQTEAAKAEAENAAREKRSLELQQQADARSVMRRWVLVGGIASFVSGIVAISIGGFLAYSADELRRANVLSPALSQANVSVMNVADRLGNTGWGLIGPGILLTIGGASMLTIWKLLDPAPKTTAGVRVMPIPMGVMVEGAF